jgi:succinate dehydrogenase / fumarate reductase cytochrome b subunit
VTLYRSTLGKKAIVAVTGLILVGYLLAHAAGNLKVFLPSPVPGEPDIDVYAEFLRTVGEPLLPRTGLLWTVRVVLLLSLVLHVVCVTQLALANRGARRTSYERRRYLATTLSGRLMLTSGVLLFVFVVFHVLHFTTGTVDPANFEAGEVYANLYRAFAGWAFVALYVVAVALVALHLYHGIWSTFQSLGLDRPERNRLLRATATVISILLFLGFSAVPLAFVSGAMSLPSELAAEPEPSPLATDEAAAPAGEATGARP